MHLRLEVEGWDRGGVHVDQIERRMVGHNMTAAGLAVLALAPRGLRERRDMIPSLRDFHRVWLPEAEGVDRAGRPGAAGLAMAIAHRLRRAFDFDLDCAAKTAPLVSHRVLH